MCLCLCGVKLSFFLVALPKKKGKRFHGNLITRMILVGKNIPPQRNISESGEKSTCFACEKACRELVCKSYNYGYANDKLCCCQHFKKTLKISRGPWPKGMGRVGILKKKTTYLNFS